MCQAGRRLTLDSPAGSVDTANQIAHVHCGGCGITLMCVPCLPALRASPLLTRCCLHRYAYGAQSIKCAVCNFVTQARRRVCGVCLCCNTRGGLTCAYPANRIDAQGSGGAAGQGSSGGACLRSRLHSNTCGLLTCPRDLQCSSPCAPKTADGGGGEPAHCGRRGQTGAFIWLGTATPPQPAKTAILTRTCIPSPRQVSNMAVGVVAQNNKG